MIRLYFLYFVRNLQRKKLFSLINLAGLTVSIACTLLIYLYVRHEFSYDNFHKHAERIYRINQTYIWGDDTDYQFSSTGPGVAYAVKAEVPEVALMTSIHTPGDFIISYTSSSNEVYTFEENAVLAADTNFFKMFNFPFVKGNETSALRNANSLVMTASTSKKYFGDENPVGKLVRLGGLNKKEQSTYEVTGVVQDPPDNSYLQFDVLLSMQGYPIDRLYWSWIWTQLETYVLLHENADLRTVRNRLDEIPRKHAEQTLQRVMNTTFDDYVKSGKKWELFLQPITGIHLPSEQVLNRLPDSGNRKIILSLIGAAVVIILLSCVNFMNLSTAQFTRRIKEVSVRKILGQSKRQLSLGYFVEAFVFCLIALGAALAITQALLPAINITTGKTLELALLSDGKLIIALLSLVCIMTLVSGSYPALFLSSFNPADAIKGKIKAGKDGKSFRNSLVVFQFTVSIVLMSSTLIVFQQLNYVAEKDLGFDKENLLILKHVEGAGNGESIAAEARQTPGVKSVSWCTSVPPRIGGGDKFTADVLNGSSFSLNYTTGDENYLPTLQLKLKEGNNFSSEPGGDKDKVILNESAIRTIGWPLDESVIGRYLEYPNSDDARFEVVGVVADFNYLSLEMAIDPMAVFPINNNKVAAGDKQFLLLRIDAQNSEAWATTLSGLNDVWKKHAADMPFEYTFVDDIFAETFQTQQQLAKVLTVLAALAMIIACLGLLGMIIYAIEQRIKEIGIRKVSGASAGNIMVLISKSYAKLIIIAFCIAGPLSYVMMQEWLKDFAYRITPSIGLFFFVGGSTLALAVLITGYHAARSARMNPIDTLKDE